MSILHVHGCRAIKQSSSLLNMLVIGGTVLFNIVVILFGIDMGTASFTSVTTLCTVRWRIFFLDVVFVIIIGVL